MAIRDVYKEVFGGSMRLTVYTTKPTTGLAKGELILLFHGSTPKLGICTSESGKQIKTISLKTKTLGRLSN